MIAGGIYAIRRTMRRLRFLTFALFVSLFITIGAGDLLAQAQLDPPRPVLSSRQRSIEVNISNPSSKPLEVTIDLQYTVVHFDSLGRISIAHDSLTDDERSRDCSGWLKVFPRRLVLPGGASRTVRLLAGIPTNTPEGEYWTRLNLDCLPTEAPAELPKLDSGDVAMGVSMSSVMSTPVLVRVGTIGTGVSVEGVSGVVDSAGRPNLVCELSRTGNSPYRGTFTAKVIGADGNEIAQGSSETTIEFTGRCGIALPILGDGAYRVELEGISTRKGSMSEIVVPADPVRRSYSMTIAGGSITMTPLGN